jgi:hypothetical protein
MRSLRLMPPSEVTCSVDAVAVEVGSLDGADLDVRAGREAAVERSRASRARSTTSLPMPGSSPTN